MSQKTIDAAREFDRKIRERVTKANAAFGNLAIAFSAIGRGIRKNWNAALAEMYRAEHGTLPGSDRTSRLRKKRRDAIDRWWGGKFDGPRT